MNETLAKARTTAAEILKQYTGEPRPMWRVIDTDSEGPTGFAPVCTADNSDALHAIVDYPGGPMRDEGGVYDCCPWPQVETYSAPFAAYVVELLNADAVPPVDHRTAALNEALDSIRDCLRVGGMQQKGLIVARKRILALIEGTTPEPPRRNVSHKQVAERCRQQPGEWLPVGEYANDQSAYGIVAAIAKGGSSVLAYLPPGSFEGRSERTDSGTLVSARYVGADGGTS